MAIFKTLWSKEKEYAFKYEGNESLKEPARAIFARFPGLDEEFFRRGEDISYRDIDFGKLGQKDDKEMEKLFSLFITRYVNDMALPGSKPKEVFTKVDIPAFLRECVDHFEHLSVEDETGTEREITSVDDFLSLPQEAISDIAHDLYCYARERDKFTMGE